MSGRVIIIGAGEAGVAAALELRARGHEGPITLLGAEIHPPYERPPLSKAFLTDASLEAPPAISGSGGLGAAGIALHLGCAVRRIERAERQVILADGTALPYDFLLLATGARARRLKLPGAETVPLHELRHLDDAQKLRGILKPHARLGIIGAGFIGLELAASGRALGCEVVVFELAPRILARAVPEELANLLAQRHAREEVEVLTGVSVASLSQDSDGWRVTLGDGRAFTFDHLIAGVGAEPDTALAAAAGLALGNGIAVDARLATADPAIFAAGDCCSFPHARYGGRRIRLESWRHATAQGRHAASSIMGATEPFAALPWFWSDQYDLHLQICGLNFDSAHLARRGTPEEGLILFDLDGAGRLIAASGLGTIGQIGRDMRIAEMLVERATIHDPAVLADKARPLKALLKA